MASINSHRRRQVYTDNRNPAITGASSGAPKTLIAFMGGVTTRADEYYANRRQFNNFDRARQGGYLNSITVKNYNHINNTETIALVPKGGGVVNPSTNYKGLTIDNETWQTLPARILSYPRHNNGILNGGYFSYRKVGTRSQYVIDLGVSIGGNIKSRATAVKWIAGNWRAK